MLKILPNLKKLIIGLHCTELTPFTVVYSPSALVGYGGIRTVRRLKVPLTVKQRGGNSQSTTLHPFISDLSRITLLLTSGI